MCTHSVHDQGKQQKDKPSTQVAEFAIFCQLCRVSCHL